MRRGRFVALLCVLAAAFCAIPACNLFRSKPAPRAEVSPATIAIDVRAEEWSFGDEDERLRSLLRAELLETGIGVPVQEGAAADLTLVIRYTDTNLTQVLAYEWQLVEASTGRIVVAGSDTSLLGLRAEQIADAVLNRLATTDTAAYASDAGAAPARRQNPEPSTTVLSPPRAATDGSKTWALIIGIEAYRDELPAAKGAEADAEAFASYARETLGVPDQHIKVLLNQRASRTDIAGAVEEWLPRNAVEPGGRVYVYFSGHGAPDVQTGDAYLVPWDANPAYLKTGGYGIGALQSSLSSLKGQEVFVFLDSCFSGVGSRSVLPDGARPLVPTKAVAAAPRVYTLTASGPGETTGAREGTGHGLFTWHLLQGLGGAADADADQRVSFDELTRHVTQAVEVEARRDNRDQRPTAVIPPGSTGQAILVEGLPGGG